MYAHLYLRWQWQITALFHRVVYVGVGVLAHPRPHGTVGTKSNQALLFGGIEDVGENGVLADVFRYVLFGIISPHLLLVDILLEDIAQHIGIDLLIVAQ